jgi:hypothetical protein
VQSGGKNDTTQVRNQNGFVSVFLVGFVSQGGETQTPMTTRALALW